MYQSLLSVLKHSSNAIVALDIKNGSVLAGNKMAREFFLNEGEQFNFSTMMGGEEEAKALLLNMMGLLEKGDTARLEDQTVYAHTGDEVPCDLLFGNIMQEKGMIFLRFRPVVDNKGFILQTFLDTRKYPAFTLNVYENLRVNLANEAFYKAFATNKEKLEADCQNQFLELLPETNRDDYENLIFKAFSEKTSGLLKVQTQNAWGKNMWLYYDMTRLTLVESDWNANLYCVMAEAGITEEDLSAEVF